MVEDLVWKVGVGHKIFINNSLSSPKRFTDLHNRKMKACGTVLHKRKKVLKLYDWKKEILCPEYREIQRLCAGRTNKKFTSLLTCTFHLRR
jgi:hypothetical protein